MKEMKEKNDSQSRCETEKESESARKGNLVVRDEMSSFRQEETQKQVKEKIFMKIFLRLSLSLILHVE